MPIVEYNADAIMFGINDNGNLVPRPTPLDMNYPTEDIVKLNEVYGYDDQYTGNYAGAGVTPTTPTMTVADNKDGSTATATISGSDPGSTVYVYGWLSFGGVLTLTNFGSRSGDGDVTITQAVGNYQAAAISQKDGSYSLPSDPWPFSISGDYDFQIRDNTARTALHILTHSRLGDTVTFQNGSAATPVNVWAKIEDGESIITLRNTVTTGEQSLRLIVPRQTSFPPGETADDWKPTATITYNSEVYEIDRVSPGNGIPKTSAEFIIECSRNSSGTY